VGTVLLTLFLPAFAARVAWMYAGQLLPIGPVGLGLSAFFSAGLGAGLVRYRVEKRVHPRLTPRRFVSGAFVRWLFFLWPLVLLLVANASTDNTFTPRSVIVLVLVGGLFAGFTAGATIPLADWLGLLRPADAALTAIVERVATQVGHRPKSVWVAESAMANAWVLFVGREMFWTSRALEVLDEDEIAAVTAHELGHLTESKAVTRTRILRLALVFPPCAARPLAGELGPWTVALLIVGFLIMDRMVGRIARRMESRADELAHTHEGDSGTYARALAKIYEANMVPPVLRGKGGVHGHLYDRMTAAGATPPYPRPKPPSRLRSSGASVVPLILGVITLLLMRVFFVAYGAVSGEQGVQLAATVGGVDDQMLETLGEEADERGADSEAQIFFDAADYVELGSGASAQPPASE